MSIFTYTDKVRIPDLDNNLNLSKKGTIRMMQEAANLASTQCGYGITNMNDTGKTWVLLYWRIKTIENVRYNEEVTIKTWTDFSKGIYSNRKFEIYSNDMLVAIADSKWLFVDTKDHSIQKITDELISLFGETKKELFESDLTIRIKLSENATKAYEYIPLKRDLDINGHVNNISFLDIALDALPNEVNIEKFNYLTIVYKKEIMYGEKISCYFENINDEYNVYLYSEDTNTLHAKITLKEQE